jgi:hypothetical protein
VRHSSATAVNCTKHHVSFQGRSARESATWLTSCHHYQRHHQQEVVSGQQFAGGNSGSGSHHNHNALPALMLLEALAFQPSPSKAMTEQSKKQFAEPTMRST